LPCSIPTAKGGLKKMARSTAGLTEPDIAELQRQLADGKRPRVQLSGPHFPVATAGTVVRIGSPAVDGADYVRVRVKVNGMTDELAFAPSELSLRRRTGKAAGGRPAKAANGRTARAGGTRATGRPAAPRPARSTARSTARSAVRSAAAKAAPAAPAEASPAAPQPAVSDSQPAGSDSQPAAQSAHKTAAQPARKAAAAKGRKPATPKVSFTVSSSGANWSLTATRGAKNLLRSVQLPPGVVSAVADLLSQSALSDAVSEINDAALAEARARAEQLRAELDQLEAVLALHRRP
jgi:hypothetical protein